MAPRNAKPLSKIELSKAKEEEIARMQVDDGVKGDKGDIDEDEDGKLEIVRLKKQREKKRKVIDRQ